MKNYYWENKGLDRRYRFQNRFRLLGQCAVYTIFAFLLFLLGSILYSAVPAFKKTYIGLDVVLDAQKSSRAILFEGLYDRLQITSRKDKKSARRLFSDYATIELDTFRRQNLTYNGSMVRVWVPASDLVDQYVKGKITLETPEHRRPLKNDQIQWVTAMGYTEQIKTTFNVGFFTNGDSRDPTQAGILVALMGSLMTLLVCLVSSMLFGVLGAIYLEEFAPKNRLTSLIEATVNNLAAVPSIVFGLLGLGVLLNVFGMPRSAALVGGLVLAIMSLPTILIASRSAIRAVPDSLRQAGLGMGATRMQVVFHHVLPAAAPGIVTGAIVAMAQALGETAPLLMIGMVSFIVDVPSGLLQPASTLPVQIFLWADLPEQAFVEKTSATIVVLLGIVFSMIAFATYLRTRFERKS